MALDCSIVRARQADAFRVGMHETGLTFKQLAHRSGHCESTLRSWASGSAAMPLAALDGLLPVLPAAALDLLLPDGFALVRVPEGVDHAEFAAAALDFAAGYAAARHPRSEAGSAIGPREDDTLCRLRVGMSSDSS